MTAELIVIMSQTAQVLRMEFAKQQTLVSVIQDLLVLTAVLFLPATTYQTAVVMDCVWITMFANVTKDGLGITVHNSLVNTWITVQGVVVV